MWYIFAVLVFPAGYSSYGGPMIIDGFKSQQTCLAHIVTLKDSVPDTIHRSNDLRTDISPRFEVIKCIEKKV